MNCNEFEKLLDDNLDGEIPPAKRVAFDDHANDCPRCGRIRDESLTLRHRLKAELSPTEPEGPDAFIHFRRNLEGDRDGRQSKTQYAGKGIGTRRLVFVLVALLLITVATAAVYASEYYNLLEALGDKDPDVRSAAVTELGENIWDPELFDILNDALESKDFEVRSSAAEALGLIVIKAKSMRLKLFDMLSDKDPRVRIKVSEALREIGPSPEVVPILMEKLKGDDPLAGSMIAYELCNWAQRDVDWMQGLVSLLLEDLKSESQYKRASAANTLGRISPEPGVVDALIEALVDEDKSVRTFAARSLAGFESDAGVVIPALVELLEDEDPQVRLSAAFTLGKFGTAAKDAVPALVASLEKETVRLGGELPVKPAPPTSFSGRARVYDLRMAIVKSLGEIGAVNEDVVPTLIKTLGDYDPELREVSATALRKIGPEAAEAVPALVKAMEDENIDVRRNAILAFKGIGPDAKEAVPALINKLKDKDEDEDLRRWVIISIREIGPEPGVVPALIEAMDDESNLIRSSAIDAFRVMGVIDSRVIPPIINALEDEDDWVRHFAARVLTQAEGQFERGITTLIDLLKSDSVGSRTARTLGDIGPDAIAALPVLRELAGSEDTEKQLRLAAGYAVAAIGRDIEETLHIIIQGLRDDDVFMRLYASDYLGRIGPDAVEAIQALLVALWDNSWQVRKNSVIALGEIGPEAASALPILRAIAAKDSMKSTREAAQEAIAKIEGMRAEDN